MRGSMSELPLPVVSPRYCQRSASRLVVKCAKGAASAATAPNELRFVDAAHSNRVVFRSHRADTQGLTTLVHERHGDVATIHQQRTARMSTFLVQAPEKEPTPTDKLFELRSVASESNSVLVARFRETDTDQLCRLVMVGDSKHSGSSIWLSRGEGTDLQRIARVHSTRPKKDKDQQRHADASDDDEWYGHVEIAAGVDQSLIVLAYLAFRDTKLHNA